MKVFVSTWEYQYGTGLCIVAANTAEEAKELIVKEMDIDWHDEEDRAKYFVKHQSAFAWTLPVESEMLYCNGDNVKELMILYWEKYQE